MLVTLGALMTASGVMFAVMGFGGDMTAFGIVGILLAVSGVYLVAANLHKEAISWRTRRRTGPSELPSPWILRAPGEITSG